MASASENVMKRITGRAFFRRILARQRQIECPHPTPRQSFLGPVLDDRLGASRAYCRAVAEGLLWGRSGSVASNPERQQCESEQPFAVVTRQQRQQARSGPDNNPLSDVGGPTGHLLQFKGKKSPLSRRRS